MTSLGHPNLVSMTILGHPNLVSMTSLGHPYQVSVTTGTRILKKRLKKRVENDSFENFHCDHCDPEVFLLHIYQDVSSV